MRQQVEAVYENGVLRPLEPLRLANAQQVSITVSTENGEHVPAEDFFRARPLTELARSQGIEARRGAEDLAGGFPGDESIDDFLAEIYAARK